MNIMLLLDKASDPIEYQNVENTYTKGNLFCILFTDAEGERMVHKYPLMNIFRIEHPY